MRTFSVFADDTSHSVYRKALQQLHMTIDKDLDYLNSWLMGNKLSLNIVKTHSMIISTRQNERGVRGEFDLKMQNTPILNVEDTKYLGIQIDWNVTWKKHADAVIKKVSRAIGLLKHVKNFLPRHLLKNLYVSIVEPHLRYCSSVWGCCSGTEIDKLQKLQNRAVRIITNSPFDPPSKPMLSNLSLESIL